MKYTAKKIGRSYPVLQELLGVLERDHGVELGGAPEIVLALATGPDWYADALARDAAAWRRFKAAFDALRGAGDGAVSPDSVTIGALTFVMLHGPRFTDAVRAKLTRPPPPLAARLNAS